MARQPRHPYVTLRWVAGGLLVLSLFACATSPVGFASLAWSGDFRLLSVVVAAIWLADLVIVTRFTIWLTSLVLLVPLCFLIPWASWILSDSLRTDSAVLGVPIAALLFGVSALYYRYVWLWWLCHPRHKAQGPAD